ncbi:hypothetical protein K402DRAFT_274527 [Aulographum hederae CBS 113979]|uniref:Uncharacterized protein n=1 Tax=Aulographum hederae CBS 113979 TaxID=1176131 RepID=A0A6G1H8Y7_9PEZI|nr:hypothetical protein K402DRAFT_274527 [Aulographum hederae CBS 113979]
MGNFSLSTWKFTPLRLNISSGIHYVRLFPFKVNLRNLERVGDGGDVDAVLEVGLASPLLVAPLDSEDLRRVSANMSSRLTLRAEKDVWIGISMSSVNLEMAMVTEDDLCLLQEFVWVAVRLREELSDFLCCSLVPSGLGRRIVCVRRWLVQEKVQFWDKP